VKERGRLGGAHGSLDASTRVHDSGQRQLAAVVAAREVVCGDSCDATRPGAQHFSAWRVRALWQVTGTAAATDGTRAAAAARNSSRAATSVRQREKEGGRRVSPFEFKI
jgi:hypothetical protein